MEIWKDINGFEGIYQVSNCGNVKSFGKKKKGSNIKPYIYNPKGEYFCQTYSLYKNYKRTHYLGHRLVATAFIDNPEKKTQVNHKDCNPLNNHVDNLEWVTQSENMIHAYRNNRAKAKLTELEVMNIFKSEKTKTELSKFFNVSYNTIRNIKSGAIWGWLTK